MGSCYLLLSVDFDRREMITNPTSEQLEKQLICEVLTKTTCPFEQQRFEVISLLTFKYDTLEWSDFADYLDSLVLRADSYVPEVVFRSATILFSQNYFSLSSYPNILQSSPYTDYTSDAIELFASDTLTIQGKIDIDPTYNQGYFSSVSIKTTYNSQDYFVTLDETSTQEYLDKNM